MEPAAAAEAPLFNEPANALSLPTWAIHVSSVVEWYDTIYNTYVNIVYNFVVNGDDMFGHLFHYVLELCYSRKSFSLQYLDPNFMLN